LIGPQPLWIVTVKYIHLVVAAAAAAVVVVVVVVVVAAAVAVVGQVKTPKSSHGPWKHQCILPQKKTSKGTFMLSREVVVALMQARGGVTTCLALTKESQY